MHFVILPLQYGDCRVHECGLVSCHCSTVTAECVDAVLYPATAVQLLQSAYMQFGILSLQYGDCIVHAAWYPAIAVR
jgi:hypothetical protein